MIARRLHCEAWKEGDFWIAQCLEISLASHGRTLDEAKRNLTDAFEAYQEDVKELLVQREPVDIVPPVRFYYWRLAKWHAQYRLQFRPAKGQKSFDLGTLMPALITPYAG